MIKHLLFLVFALHYRRQQPRQQTIHEAAQEHQTHAEKLLNVTHTRDVAIAYCDDRRERKVDGCHVHIPV